MQSLYRTCAGTCNGTPHSKKKWEFEFGLSAVWAEYCKRTRAGRPRPQGADRPVAGDRTGRRILSQKPSVSLSIGALVLAPA